MNKKIVVVALASIAVITASCVSTFKNTNQSDVRDIASDGTKIVEARGEDYDFVKIHIGGADKLNDDKIRKYASAELKLSEGRVIKDNDESFKTKLEMINKARKSIRMVYFIHAGDDSSSVLNQALIARARDNVQVRLLVDFITNYKNIDLFQMMEAQGNGNLKVFFYNTPDTRIIEDANYSVLPCPEKVADQKVGANDCYDSKMKIIGAMGNTANIPTPMAKIFLSGLYGKNATAFKVALGYGAKINPADYKQAPKSPEQATKEKEQLLEFLKLVSEAYFKHDVLAKLKLSIAMSTYGDTLNPLVNEATGRLPIKSMNKDVSHAEVWDHLSDYTHHKLLVIDGEEFILGGRNVEDSYHMKARVSATGKYIFVDTDFWGKTEVGGAIGLEKSYDKMVITPMVKNLGRILEITATDFMNNIVRSAPERPSAAEMAVGTCATKSDVGACILESLSKMPGYKNAEVRMQTQQTKMVESATRYTSKYPAVSSGIVPSVDDKFDGTMSANDLKSAAIFYLENVSYDKNNARIIGAKLGAEAANEKNIHAAWYKALEHACYLSNDKKQHTQVIFHTAYLLMPSAMIYRLSRMMNGDYGNCARVTIKFITNSVETTDLGPINLMARYQLGALFDYSTSLLNEAEARKKENGKSGRQSPILEYYEVVTDKNGTGKSLHTKTSLIGEDLIIGSANADVRSYYMDTNNAIMIRNAKELNQKYRDYIQTLISTGAIQNRMGQFLGKTPSELRAENKMVLAALAKRWRQDARLTSDRETAILNEIDRLGAQITETTKALLTYRSAAQPGMNDALELNARLNKLANRFDSTFKLF